MAVDRHLRAHLMGLPEDQRADLAFQLIRSLDPAGPEPGAGAAWASEINRRLNEVDLGRAKLVSWDDVQSRLRQSLGQGRNR